MLSIALDNVADAKQILKWCLGSAAVGGQFGAVSCLSFNKDCTRLLCGFAKGQVCTILGTVGYEYLLQLERFYCVK